MLATATFVPDSSSTVVYGSFVASVLDFFLTGCPAMSDVAIDVDVEEEEEEGGRKRKGRGNGRRRWVRR